MFTDWQSAIYPNGRIPESALVRLDTGTATGRGRHVTTKATALRYYGFRRDVKRETGVTMYISSGMNAYRDWDEQGVGKASACAQGNCAAAASQGGSSHGGSMAYRFTNYRRVAAMAFDIGNYWAIPWAVFKRLAEKWGFLVGYITREIANIEEPWHLIDPYCFQAVTVVEQQYGVRLTEGADGIWRLTDAQPAQIEVEKETPVTKIIAGPNGGQKFIDDLGADDIGAYFYAPTGGPSWSDNVHAAWLWAGKPGEDDTTNDQWQYELARHQANARWDAKRGQIVSDVVSVLKPFFAELGTAIAGINPERFEQLIEQGLKNVVVTPAAVSEKDRDAIAAAVRDEFTERPLR